MNISKDKFTDVANDFHHYFQESSIVWDNKTIIMAVVQKVDLLVINIYFPVVNIHLLAVILLTCW